MLPGYSYTEGAGHMYKHFFSLNISKRVAKQRNAHLKFCYS